MTPFDIAMNQQRLKIEALNTMVRSLNSETLRLKFIIIAAAGHAFHGNNEAALKIITDHAETIHNETTDQLANNHAGATNQNGHSH